MRRNYWRLPTIDELCRMFDREKGEPRISGFGSEDFWSSTLYANSNAGAWIVDFNDGHTDYYDKSFTYCARCVREDENGRLGLAEASGVPMSWDMANKYCKRMNDEK